MKLEEELVVQHHWEERVGGQSEGRVGGSPRRDPGAESGGWGFHVPGGGEPGKG